MLRPSVYVEFPLGRRSVDADTRPDWILGRMEFLCSAFLRYKVCSSCSAEGAGSARRSRLSMVVAVFAVSLTCQPSPLPLFAS